MDNAQQAPEPFNKDSLITLVAKILREDISIAYNSTDVSLRQPPIDDDHDNWSNNHRPIENWSYVAYSVIAAIDRFKADDPANDLVVMRQYILPFAAKDGFWNGDMLEDWLSAPVPKDTEGRRLYNAIWLYRRQEYKQGLAERIEKLEILGALADMYGQYCDGPYGHDFMSAGERAIEILESYKLASENKGVNYKAVEKLENKLSRLQQELMEVK